MLSVDCDGPAHRREGESCPSRYVLVKKPKKRNIASAPDSCGFFCKGFKSTEHQRD